MAKTIKTFKVVEHFINKAFSHPIECGIYEIATDNEHCFVVQTDQEYRAISHNFDTTNLFHIKDQIIDDIKELLRGEQ